MRIRPRVLSAVIGACAILALAACSGGGGAASPTATPSAPDDGKEPASNVRLTLVTAQAGGYFGNWGAAAADVINRHSDTLEITAATSGGSNENLGLLSSGQADLGLVVNDTLYKAYTGELDVSPADDLETIFSTGGEFMLHIVVPEDSAATSLEDLKGEEVAFGSQGSGHYTTAADVLPALGLDFSDFNAQYLSLNEMTAAFKNGTIAAFVATGDPPQPPIADAAGTPRGIKLLPLSDADIASAREDRPYLLEATIPAGVYEGVDEGVTTVAVSGGSLVATTELSDDIAREIAQILDENHEEILDIVGKAGSSTAERTVDAAVTPIAPGAASYFESIGLDLR